MTFEVKYRNKQGATEYIRVDADSRAEVFAVLKNRGIASVIQVTDATGKKPRKVATSGAPISGKIKGLMALVAVCVIGMVAYLFVVQDAPKPTKPVEKRVEKKSIEVVKPEITHVVEEAPKIDEEAIAREKKRKSLRDMLKNMTPEERANYQWEKFKSEPIDLTVPSNRVFATGTEQIMSWIFTTEVGTLPPPLPMIPGKERAHFAEILLSDNAITENDSEKSANAKEMVALAKKELIDYIKKGGDVDDFFDYYRGQLVQAHQEREEYRKAAMKVMKEEPEIANDFIDELNAKLEEKGIKKLEFHPKMKAHFGVPE